MYLFINSLAQNRIVLFLIINRTQRVRLTLPAKQSRGENILKGLDKLLKKANKGLKGIRGVIVVNGPGSFAGIRVALSVANTLSWLLKIPVVGVSLTENIGEEGIINNQLIKIGLNRLAKTKKGRAVRPFYGKKPNISKPKSRL